MERWAPAPGFGPYEVSDMGRLRRVLTRAGRRMANPRIVKTRIDREGYRIGSLSVGGKWYYPRVARLVLLAFVGKPPTRVHQAAHSHGDPGDDRLSGLRWATPRENNLDKASHGTQQRGERCNFAKLTETQVLAIRARRHAGSTMAAIAVEMGASRQNVANVCNRISWRHLP